MNDSFVDTNYISPHNKLNYYYTHHVKQFAECTVGPWTNDVLSIHEDVEEVMRSCGGAVQGIRELPLSLIFSTPEITEGEDRTYHNRADGGFVYVDDGSYCSGPEHWNWNNADNETSRNSCMMASLAFPNNRRRMWLTIKSSDASKLVAKRPKEQHLLNSKVLELSRPTPISLTDSNEESNDSDTIALTSSNIPTIIWSEVQRVRMSSSGQPWTLARAKWEKQLLADTNEEIKDAANEMKSFTGKLRGWAYINQDDNNLFEDVASDSVNLHMLAVCSESKVARSAVRCYDADGSLKSVVFLTGLLSQEGTE